MKRAFAISTVLAGALIMSAQAQPAEAQTTLKFAWQLPLTNYASKGAQQLAQCIGEKSNGAIKVESYPAGQLYRARQLYEAARNGAVEMAMFSVGSFATTDPLADIVYLPFVVSSQQRMTALLHGELGKKLDEIAGKVNLKILAYFAGSGGQFGTKSRALRTPDDFKGLKIRVPGSIPAEVVKSFGGVPTTVDPAEVYLALQRGTIDGTNFPLTSFYDRKLYEVLGYLTLANVSFDSDTVVIGEAAFSKVSEAGRKAIQDCAAASEKWVREEESRLNKQYVQLLREKGMQVIELSPQERLVWRKAADNIVQDFEKKHGAAAKELVDVMQK